MAVSVWNFFPTPFKRPIKTLTESFCFESRSSADEKLRPDAGHWDHFRLRVRLHGSQRFKVQRSRVRRFQVIFYRPRGLGEGRLNFFTGVYVIEMLPRYLSAWCCKLTRRLNEAMN